LIFLVHPTGSSISTRQAQSTRVAHVVTQVAQVVAQVACIVGVERCTVNGGKHRRGRHG